MIQIFWSCPNVLMISCAADDSVNAILCWAHYCETSAQLYFWNSAFIRCSFYTQSCCWCLKWATFFFKMYIFSFLKVLLWIKCGFVRYVNHLLEIIPTFSELSFFLFNWKSQIWRKKIRCTHTKQQLFFILPVSC